ncbi:MAG: hypothetical protein ABEK10_01100 [Candidatus Nanosalina sp.]
MSDGIGGLEDLTRYGDVRSGRGVSRGYVPLVIQGDYTDLSLDQDLEQPLLENYVVDTQTGTCSSSTTTTMLSQDGPRHSTRD